MKCTKCKWSWEIEKNDEHPYLCHKCGYDSKLKEFNIKEYNKWKKENPSKLKHLKEFKNY